MRYKISDRVILLFIILLFIGAAAVYLIWNRPHQDIRNSKAVEVTAITLYHALANDSSNIKKTYINRIVAVSGEVKRIIQNRQKQQVILLKTNTEHASVNCTLEENTKNIREGDIVILKGVCMGYSGGDVTMGIPGDVYVIRCYPL